MVGTQEPQTAQHKRFGSFGTYRFFLASCVAAGHIGGYYYSARISVFMFYLLSGYVVSMALAGRYMKIDHGIAKFYLNRVLRIFPLYWAILLVSVVIMMNEHGLTRHLLDGRFSYAGAENLENSALWWIKNVFLIGTTDFSGRLLKPQVIPPSWSVGVELMLWFILPLLLKYRFLRGAALVLGFMYWCGTIFMAAQGSILWDHILYYGISSALFPFMIGVYIHESKEWNLRNIPHVIAWIAIISYVWLILGDRSNAIVMKMAIGSVLGSMIVYYLSHIDLRPVSRTWHQVDMLLGHMAYPMLLVHELMGVCILFYTDFADKKGVQLLLVSYPAICLVSLLLYLVFEKPLHRLRSRLRV